ncbi:MAG: HEAT repeat protein [Planctomycetota bacterium]|jgi:HEAT repeat protein
MMLFPRSRSSWLTLTALLVLALVSSAASMPWQDSHEENLKSKDPMLRLLAARAVITEGGEDAEKILLKLLKDDDWEVVIVAAEGLGEHGDEKSIDPLVKLAYSSPLLHIRAVAALSLAKLNAEEARAELSKKLKKDTAIPACEALVLIAPSLDAVEVSKGLKKLLKDKQLDVRAAASAAMVALTREGRGKLMDDLLDSDHLSVRARALEIAAEQPHYEQVKSLRKFLGQAEIKDVVLRRALPAMAAGIDRIEKNPGSQFTEVVQELCADKEARIAIRGALLARLALSYPWGKSLDLTELTLGAREHSDPGVRAGAAQFLRYIGGERALEAVHTLFDGDSSVRVRLAAFHTIVALQPVTTDETRTWIIEQLSKEGSSELREAMVVTLGDKEMMEQGDAVQALIETLADNDSGVRVCGAVSLGLTRSEHAVDPLGAILNESEDWRMRGAALVGLTKSLQKSSVKFVIEALADTEPLVVRSAQAFLISIARGEEIDPTVEAWREWWLRMEAKIRLYDPREQQERNKRYGYAATPDEIYRGLDVLVLNSRGDHIQAILERLGIDHRLTISNQVKTDGLDASGIFISNCTGELEHEDLDRLEWFVKVGGYLCGSCWALTETIDKIAPGIVTKVITRDEIVDSVPASACDTGSKYTRDVFGEYVIPIYRLEGAHIIRVLQPERVEMLVDSVECAEKWGGGNLACWFSYGHGTILDSANHFQGQGFAYALGLKKPVDRKAYAVNHMGATLERIRETADEKFWGSTFKAGENIIDYSVFRLVTNFVRLRRKEGL